MKVLVTGGSGFLGSHVADALQEAGHEVTILDLKRSPWLQDGQSFLQGDINDENLLEKALDDQEAVYHFAAISSIDECLVKPIEVTQINVGATVKIAEKCIKKGVKKFIFGSTVYVYSRSGSFYRASKQAAESFLDVFMENGLELTVLRYGSLYGPRAGKDNSIRNLLEQAIGKNKIVYYGTGQERREFIHVIDAARASVKALETSYNGFCLTLTGPEVWTYSNVLQILSEMWPTSLEIEYIASTNKAHYVMTPYHYTPRSGKKLLVNPFTDLGQGLLNYLTLLQKESNE